MFISMAAGANHTKPPSLSYVRFIVAFSLHVCCAARHSELIIPFAVLPHTETAPPSSLTASLASASSLASSLSAHADEFSSLASANAYETTLSDGSVVTVTPTPFVSTLSNGDQTTVTPTPSTSTMSDGRTTVVFSPTPNDGSLQDDSDDDGGGGTPIWAIVVPSACLPKCATRPEAPPLTDFCTSSHFGHLVSSGSSFMHLAAVDAATAAERPATSGRALFRAQHAHGTHEASRK